MFCIFFDSQNQVKNDFFKADSNRRIKFSPITSRIAPSNNSKPSFSKRRCIMNRKFKDNQSIGKKSLWDHFMTPDSRHLGRCSAPSTYLIFKFKNHDTFRSTYHVKIILSGSANRPALAGTSWFHPGKRSVPLQKLWIHRGTSCPPPAIPTIQNQRGVEKTLGISRLPVGHPL